VHGVKEPEGPTSQGPEDTSNKRGKKREELGRGTSKEGEKGREFAKAKVNYRGQTTDLGCPRRGDGNFEVSGRTRGQWRGGSDLGKGGKRAFSIGEMPLSEQSLAKKKREGKDIEGK